MIILILKNIYSFQIHSRNITSITLMSLEVKESQNILIILDLYSYCTLSHLPLQSLLYPIIKILIWTQLQIRRRSLKSLTRCFLRWAIGNEKEFSVNHLSLEKMHSCLQKTLSWWCLEGILEGYILIASRLTSCIIP